MQRCAKRIKCEGERCTRQRTGEEGGTFTDLNGADPDRCSTLIYREQSTITKLQWLKLDPYSYQTES